MVERMSPMKRKGYAESSTWRVIATVYRCGVEDDKQHVVTTTFVSSHLERTFAPAHKYHVLLSRLALGPKCGTYVSSYRGAAKPIGMNN